MTVTSLIEPIKVEWWVYVPPVFIFNTLIAMRAICIDTLSIVDICWSLMFTIPNAIIMYYRRDQLTNLMILVMTLVSVWAARLSIHIGSRFDGQEDWRYKVIKARWGHRGPCCRRISAWAYVFMMQAAFTFINNASALYVMKNSMPGESVNQIFLFAGVSVWVTGQFFEIVGDRQLQAFRNDQRNKGQIMNKGLWRYSRHPNYFGECFSWWGVWLIACSIGGYGTIYSAVFITLLIRYISGPRFIEDKSLKRKSVEKQADFRVYMTETNMMFPMPYTKHSEQKRAELWNKFKKEAEAN